MAGKEKGFAFSFDETQDILRVQLWGFWDRTTGQEFLSAFGKKIQEESFSGKEWYLLADLIRFLPQQKEIRPFLNRAMVFAKQHGLKKTARLVDNTITQIQIRRLSKESHFPENAFFKSENAAIRWLLGPEKFL